MTAHLREQNIPYSWGHPFRLIFKHNGKLVQISSLEKALTILGLQSASKDMDPVHPARERRRITSGWQRVGSGPSTSKPDKAASQREREDALSSVVQATDRPATP